jgi:RNA polymerase sigma-70 factor (ECF subfamily)
MLSMTSWADAIDRLRPFVARRVPAADVDDVVQDVLVRAHRGVGALRDDRALGPWLYAIARTAIADRGRARARADRAWQPPANDPEDAVEARLAGVIAIFVAQLPSPYREAITLVDLEACCAIALDARNRPIACEPRAQRCACAHA